METRARYALIGLFMLAVIAASFGFVYWLENKGGFSQRETYLVKFQGSVSGLLVGSAVLFNGLRVGEVTELGLKADAPQDVTAMIAVERGTPIRSDTVVSIETQGLTGGGAVALKGGSIVLAGGERRRRRAADPCRRAAGRARTGPRRRATPSSMSMTSWRQNADVAAQRHRQYRHLRRRAGAQLRQGRRHPGRAGAHGRRQQQPGRDPGLRSRRRDQFSAAARAGRRAGCWWCPSRPR